MKKNIIKTALFALIITIIFPGTWIITVFFHLILLKTIPYLSLIQSYNLFYLKLLSFWSLVPSAIPAIIIFYSIFNIQYKRLLKLNKTPKGLLKGYIICLPIFFLLCSILYLISPITHIGTREEERLYKDFYEYIQQYKPIYSISRSFENANYFYISFNTQDSPNYVLSSFFENLVINNKLLRTEDAHDGFGTTIGKSFIICVNNREVHLNLLIPRGRFRDYTIHMEINKYMPKISCKTLPETH